jgi:demethylmenaquinone methyltransferase/2-methoxy-6-polyprenyl-1,4-benzoquinol methylase
MFPATICEISEICGYLCTMPESVTPYHTSSGKKEQVAEMFDNIAPKYDFLNQLLSLGIHKGWRKKSVKLLISSQPKIMLDVATGTGDFAIEANKRLNPEKIIGVDISEGMMKFGREKLEKLGLSHKIELQVGDSENLSFAENSFDAITVGFGVRNFENLEKGLAGMFRVLKPGGTLVVLEFSRPRKFPVKQLFNFYFNRVTPFIGKVFSKDNRAYTYLPESVNAFPDGENFVSILQKTGFSSCSWQPLTFGIASIYTGKKP